MSDAALFEPEDLVGPLNRLVRTGSIDGFEFRQSLVLIDLRPEQWARLRQDHEDEPRDAGDAA